MLIVFRPRAAQTPHGATRIAVAVFALLSLSMGLGCGTSNPHRELLSEYYWESQNYRYSGGGDDAGAVALRDLGVLYLRTGYPERALDVLTRSLAQDRTDPKRWLYAGVAQELLGRKTAALATYERFLSLTSGSIYTRVMRGRAAWLRDATTTESLVEAARSTDTVQFRAEASGRYAVFPIDCVSDRSQFASIGIGLADLLSYEMESLRNVDMVEPHLVRLAYNAAGEAVNRPGTTRPVWAGRALGAARILGGSCQIASNGTLEIDLVLRDLNSGEVYSVSGTNQIDQIAALEQDLIRDLATQLRIWIPDRENQGIGRRPTLDAFLAYSNGLVSEGNGDYEASYALYSQALANHPSFTLADVRRTEVENRLLARAETPDDFIELVVRLEAIAATDGILDSGITQLESTLGSSFMPGQHGRKLPPGSIGELPTPPNPVRN
jgi:tetratricopeptide (TPR) repeat protein